jgi:Holliday junction resolvase RusA-like endonuclease
MNKEIKIFVTLDSKIQSINSMYKAGLIYRGGKPVPYIYKSAESKRMCDVITEALRAVDFTEHIEWLTTTTKFTVTQNYIFKSGISRRDVGNCEKAISDAVTRFIHDELGISSFDDSKFTDLHLYKSIIPHSDHEYICVSIKPSTFNIRFDQVTKPEQLYFHFTSDQYDTKDFKKEMKDLEIKYCFENSKRQLKDWNADFFLLKDPGINETVDLMDFIYKHKDSSFVLVMTNSNDLKKKINEIGSSMVKAWDIQDSPINLIKELIV